MEKPQIVILRGNNASGKTTAFYNLRNYIFKDKKVFKNWIFIDNNSVKQMFSNLEDSNWKPISKEILLEIIEKVLPLKKSIIIEETSKEMLIKYFSKELKKYDYRITTFQFIVSLEEAIKRDKKRVDEKTHPGLGKLRIKELREFHSNGADKEGIIVNTDKLNQKQVVKSIIKKITNQKA